MIRAGVIGAAGYAGIECVRILLGHPDFEPVLVTSDADEGHAVGEVYPPLFGACDLVFEKLDVDAVIERCDIVFLAVPHTASLAVTPRFIEAGLTVIDLSADYRLKDPAVYEKWYGVPHTSTDLLAQAAFGLPELTGEELEAIKDAPAKLVACAGCYPTATSLAAAPAAKAGLLTSQTVISDCLSGVSGAGRKPSAKTIFCSAHEDARVYGVGTHRHTPEMSQILSGVAGSPVDVVFTPHLIPIKRGILATVHLHIDPSVTVDELHALYTNFYKTCPFVEVYPAGVLPGTSDVEGTNMARISISASTEPGHMIANCVIDNLVKGAAGQAVQCANIVMGLPQTSGLMRMLPPVV